jgi:hypothetical protein
MVWGTFSAWGGERGTVVAVGTTKDPSFTAVAKNSAGEVTASSAPAAASGWLRVHRDFLSSALVGVALLLGLAVFIGLSEREPLKVLRRGKKRKK